MKPRAHRVLGSAFVPSVLLGLLTVVSPGALAQAQCFPGSIFLPPVAYPSGNMSIEVAVADFNHDGILDIAAANFGAASIAILIGRGSAGVGDGTFEPPVTYPSGDAPRSIKTGDFNQDGILDLAVPLLYRGDLAILIGRGHAGVGDGSFEPPVFYPSGGEARYAETGDFNHDGITDLAVVNSAIDQISLFLGNGIGGVGDGTFAAGLRYPTDSYPYHLVARDFDEDGNLDLAVACSFGHSVALLPGWADGSFGQRSSFASSGVPKLLTDGDFNADGILDLAVVNNVSRTVSILIGLGSGGVGTGRFADQVRYTIGRNAESIVAADLDRDGRLDLAVSAGDDNALSVLLGLGDGRFASRISQPAGRHPTGLAIGDFNGDGAPDVVAANFLDTYVSVLLNCNASPPAAPNPVLTAVRDVPDDNGGKVFVTWLRSPRDVPGLNEISGYRVWRRIHPAASMPAGSSGSFEVQAIRSTGPDGASQVTYWEAIATLPAERLEGYGYTAPTTQDSMRHSNPYTAFFISALTADPFVTYPSNVDSGYSVDNLKPGRPRSFTASLNEAGGVWLVWDSVDDSDWAGYRLYRGTDPNFDPTPDDRIASPTDTIFFDAAGNEGHSYKLSSVDLRENESEHAVATPAGAVAVLPSASVFALRGVYPNPSPDRLRVAFTLAAGAPAWIELVDLAGRVVERDDLGGLSGGHHQIVLGHSQPPSGLYWVRLVQGKNQRVARAVIFR